MRLFATLYSYVMMAADRYLGHRAYHVLGKFYAWATHEEYICLYCDMVDEDHPDRYEGIPHGY